MEESVTRVLIIYAHPTTKNSLNAEILNQVCIGLKQSNIDFKIRDLVAHKFQPVIEEQEWRDGFLGKVPEECLREQEHITWADGLVWIFPAWNFSIPAILKGYLDRVFMIPGFSLDMGDDGTRYQGGLLRHKRGLVFQTLGTDLASGFRFGNVTQYAAPVVAGMHYAGIKNVSVTQIWNLYDAMGPELLTDTLARVKELAAGINAAPSRHPQIISTSF